MSAPKGNNYALGNEGGRPTDYDPDFHPQEAYELCLLGSTDEQLAEDFGITTRTLDNWKKKHYEFFRALSRGKRSADAKVARSLFERACGYQHPETKYFVVKVDQNLEEVQERETIARYPPDTKAATVWLSNRTRNWRERQADAPKPLGEGGEPGTSRSTPFTVIDPKTNETKILEIGAADNE
ncbi:hypothetical protein DYBT9623_00699 [Dyadobacter sp. CECT 9623]|uniref:Terminase n=1 Tax=Dyadobacter linearis TaxID=2823330 RepID=A0ABM8UKD6_9BACT|nr:terminase [Dyadobacter sp. CECT 9623]CAG5067971.1 hypothetical protein DYBT9623_00699 [Dyadobacter sp. CECT 9623]